MVKRFGFQVFRFLEEIAVNEGDFLHHSILLNIFLCLRTILDFDGGYFEARFPLHQQYRNDAATGADIQYRLAG